MTLLTVKWRFKGQNFLYHIITRFVTTVKEITDGVDNLLINVTTS